MVTLETMAGSLVSLIMGGVIGWFSRVAFYEYKKKDQRDIQKSRQREEWYQSTIQLANDIQTVKSKHENESTPHLKQHQRELDKTADQLSAHFIDGKNKEINQDVLDMVQEAEDKCRKVVQQNTNLSAFGIGTELQEAAESAENLKKASEQNMEE